MPWCGGSTATASAASKIENKEEHKDARKVVNLIKVLKLTQGVMCQFQDEQSLSILESKLRIHRHRQKPGQPLSECHKGFKQFFAACKHHGGSFGCEKGLVESIL